MPWSGCAGRCCRGSRSDAKDPETLASRRFNELAFGDHPYGSSGDGTEESVAALTRDDIVEAHKASMTRDRLFVAAVGDITAAELGPLLDGCWAICPPSAGKVRPGRMAGGGRGRP
jgi:zinc protease